MSDGNTNILVEVMPAVDLALFRVDSMAILDIRTKFGGSGRLEANAGGPARRWRNRTHVIKRNGK